GRPADLRSGRLEHLGAQRPCIDDDCDRIGGGALMQAVNLLPDEHKIRAKKRSTPADNLDARKTLRTGSLAALAVVVLLGALYGYERNVVSRKKWAFEKDKAALAEIKPKADAIKAAQASTSARLSVIAN